jgi:hypothetical protein
LRILQSIDSLIVKYQSDAVTLSDVLSDFHRFLFEFNTPAMREVLSEEEINYLLSVSALRFEFMYSEAHGLRTCWIHDILEEAFRTGTE